jgi:hypothetical protein
MVVSSNAYLQFGDDSLEHARWGNEGQLLKHPFRRRYIMFDLGNQRIYGDKLALWSQIGKQDEVHLSTVKIFGKLM